MRGVRALVGGLMGLAVVGAAAPAVASAAPLDAVAVAQTSQLLWTPCPVVPPGPPDDELQLPPLPVECATLLVPLDHDRPQGRQVTLALYRLPAPPGPGRLGSLVMNPGGPGVPTQEFLAGVSAGVPQAVAARYDLVTFDPRGVGASEGLACGGPDLLVEATGDEFADQEAFGRALGARCLAEDAALVDTMTSTDIARDLELVRAALGDEQLAYLGFSWGTLLGGLYAELFPARVGRMVLDGAIDPNLGYLEEVRRSTIGAEAVLASFFALCDANPACALQPYGAEAVYRFVAWQAAEGELSSPDGRTLSLEQLYSATYAALAAGRFAFPIFAEWLLEAAQGDATQLIDLAEAYASGLPAGPFFAIRCGDSAERYSRATVQQAASEVLPAAPNLYLGLLEPLGCAGLPVSSTDRPPVAVGADELAPVLVIGNTLDPATPYSGAVGLSDALGGSRLLTFEGEGHTIAFQGLDCVDDAVTAYLLGGTLPPEGAVCQAPPFLLGAQG